MSTPALYQPQENALQFGDGAAGWLAVRLNTLDQDDRPINRIQIDAGQQEGSLVHIRTIEILQGEDPSELVERIRRHASEYRNARIIRIGVLRKGTRNAEDFFSWHEGSSRSFPSREEAEALKTYNEGNALQFVLGQLDRSLQLHYESIDRQNRANERQAALVHTGQKGINEFFRVAADAQLQTLEAKDAAAEAKREYLEQQGNSAVITELVRGFKEAAILLFQQKAARRQGGGGAPSQGAPSNDFSQRASPAPGSEQPGQLDQPDIGPGQTPELLDELSTFYGSLPPEHRQPFERLLIKAGMPASLLFHPTTPKESDDHHEHEAFKQPDASRNQNNPTDENIDSGSA